jgi:hypothetical protein
MVYAVKSMKYSLYLYVCTAGSFCGADPPIRAGPPGPALPLSTNFAEADEGVGCGPGARPTVQDRG